MATKKQPKKYTGDTIMSLARFLLDNSDPDMYDEKILMDSYKDSGLDAKTVAEKVAKAKALGDLKGGVSTPQLFGLAGNAVRSHPIKSLGLGASLAGNIGGMFDDNKIGGQLGGLALGAIAGNALQGAGANVSPFIAASIGGNLGSLFDKLRKQKELEQQQAQQQLQGGRYYGN